MAWSASAIFVQALVNPLMASTWSTTEPTTYGANGLSADTIKVALFNNTTTPDKAVAVGSTGFNTGVWVTGNEVTDATNWVSGGRSVTTGKAFSTNIGSAGTNVLSFDMDDATGGGNVTIANAYGCLVYDDTITAGTVADQGLCYNYFGGSPQGVSGGTFTVVFDATGVFKVTV